MLHLYLNDYPLPKNLPYVMDIEKEWAFRPRIDATFFIQKVVNTFDGKYKDAFHFVSKFTNQVISRNWLSTSSKAAILLSQEPNKVYYFGEVGTNVRDFVFANLHEGHIHMVSDTRMFNTTSCDLNTPLEIWVNGEVVIDWTILDLWLKEGEHVHYWFQS